MANRDELQRIAAAMNQLRPDWPVRSLITFLEAHHAGRAYRDLAVAATAVATDPKTKTPNLLNESGPWWSAAQVVAGSTSTQVPRPQQARCVVHPFELADPCRECRAEELAAGEASPGPSISPEQAARNVAGARLVRAAGSRPLDVRERAAGETGDE